MADDPEIAQTDAPEAAPKPGKKSRKSKLVKRSDELSMLADVAAKLDKVFEAVEKGFNDQNERADRILDYWDAYNCELSRYQNYSGMSKLYVPIIRNAVVALVTRYINQAFPNSGRHVEVITGEQDIPYALMSLVEHYIERGKMRTQAIPAILTNGQVEGQYNAYVRWENISRYVVSRETKPMEQDGLKFTEAGTIEEIVEEKIDDECPMIEALHDNDVLVLPATAESVEQALESGGSVTVIRRWSKEKIRTMADDDEIVASVGDDVVEEMTGVEAVKKDVAKKLASSAGIYLSGKSAGLRVYETWTKIKVGGKKRLCRAYYAGDKKVLGCKLSPFWNDCCPVLSAPVKKLPGVFKGESPVAACMDMQVQANDAVNQAGDMMYYSLAPIVTVDPEKVTKWKDLVADVAAVWPVDPTGVKMFEWPNKTQEALQVVAFNKGVIFETLGVNPSMLPQQTGSKAGKRNQAEVALEQQVDLLTTADAVTNLEGEILTPAVQRFAEYDHQFREKDVLVREFGELGLAAGMESIPPIQMGNRWRLRWSGVEAARSAANIQQQIGWVGTVMKLPPQLYMGYRLNLAPLLEYSAGQVFPSRLARQIFKSMKDEMSVDPKVENKMLDQGFEVNTHAADNDQEHLQVHMQGLAMAQASPNPQTQQQYRAHIQMHQAAMRMKQAAMAAQGAPGKPPGAAGGGGPRAGAQPHVGPKRPQQQAGAIHPDQMARAGAPGAARRG